MEAEGGCLAELLLDLDRRYPGLRFRIVDEQDGLRPHVKFFVNKVQVRGLDAPLRPSDATTHNSALFKLLPIFFRHVMRDF